jgi:hypothetical protein
MRTNVLRVTTLIALLSAAFLAACGNTKTPTQTPQQIVSGAAAATAAAKSSKIDITVLTSGVSGSGDMTIAGMGAFDYGARTGRMTMTVPTGTTSMTLEMVLSGTLIYEKLPDVAAQQLGGKPWIKIDLADLSKLVSFDVSTLASSQSSNPAQALDFLRGVSSDVKEAGSETIRGAKTTHYQFTVDVAKAAAAAPEAQKQAMQHLAELYKDQQFSFDAWIDGDGRLRKMTYAVDLAKLKMPAEATAAMGAKALTGTITSTIELYDFGTAVKADVPPADQVTDFQTLMSSFKSGASESSVSGSGTATPTKP